MHWVEDGFTLQTFTLRDILLSADTVTHCPPPPPPPIQYTTTTLPQNQPIQKTPELARRTDVRYTTVTSASFTSVCWRGHFGIEPEWVEDKQMDNSNHFSFAFKVATRDFSFCPCDRETWQTHKVTYPRCLSKQLDGIECHLDAHWNCRARMEDLQLAIVGGPKVSC